MDPLFELALSVKAGHRAMERLMNDALVPVGLTSLQADALSVIGQTGEISLKDLGDLLIAEAGHPSRLVDRLVASGHVERRPGADDRRRVVLSLTAKGRELERTIDKTRTDVLAMVAPLVSPPDVTAALRLFRALLDHTDYGAVMQRRRALAQPPPER